MSKKPLRLLINASVIFCGFEGGATDKKLHPLNGELHPLKSKMHPPPNRNCTPLTGFYQN